MEDEENINKRKLEEQSLKLYESLYPNIIIDEKGDISYKADPNAQFVSNSKFESSSSGQLLSEYYSLDEKEKELKEKEEKSTTQEEKEQLKKEREELEAEKALLNRKMQSSKTTPNKKYGGVIQKFSNIKKYNS